ncbi:MAG: hypothetical protein ACRDTC_06820 [Pseudonocardiaceae bacterium]
MAVLAVATAASYLVWTAWNRYREFDAQGSAESPYEPWQASGLMLVLIVGVLAGVAGWRRCAWAAVLVIPTVLTLCISIIGATDPDGDGLWVIGAMLVMISSFLWVCLVAVPAEAISRRIAR